MHVLLLHLYQFFCVEVYMAVNWIQRNKKDNERMLSFVSSVLITVSTVRSQAFGYRGRGLLKKSYRIEYNPKI